MKGNIILLSFFLLMARYCEDPTQYSINEGAWNIRNQTDYTVIIDKGNFEPSEDYRIGILYPRKALVIKHLLKDESEDDCCFEDLWNHLDDNQKGKGLEVKVYSIEGVLLNEWKWPEDTDRKGSFFDKDRWAEQNDSRKSIRSYWWAFELKPEDLDWPDEI